MLSIDYLVTTLIVVLLPGTGVLYTLSVGLLQGGRASLAAAFGCTLGITPHLLASILGLTAVLHFSAVVFQVIKFIGVAYLLYLAWAMWKDSSQMSFGQAGQGESPWRIIVKAILINCLNPKLTLFFLAFIPQFIVPEQGQVLAQVFTLASVFMVITFAVFVLYGLLAHSVRAYVLASPKIVKRIKQSFAGCFAALGLKLATTE